jgi:hypothetical protein
MEMRKTNSLPTNETESLPVEAVRSFVCEWLMDGQLSNHFARTLETRKDILSRLIWFLESGEYTLCNVDALRAFFFHLANGHKEPGGRWGNPKNTRPVSSGTLVAYQRDIRAFFSWVVRACIETG